MPKEAQAMKNWPPEDIRNWLTDMGWEIHSAEKSKDFKPVITNVFGIVLNPYTLKMDLNQFRHYIAGLVKDMAEGWTTERN